MSPTGAAAKPGSEYVFLAKPYSDPGFGGRASAYFTSDRLIMATATRLNVLGPTLTIEQGTSELSGCARYDALLFADGFEEVP